VLEPVIAIGDAELGGGNAELAVVGGDADIVSIATCMPPPRQNPRMQAIVGFG